MLAQSPCRGRDTSKALHGPMHSVEPEFRDQFALRGATVVGLLIRRVVCAASAGAI